MCADVPSKSPDDYADEFKAAHEKFRQGVMTPMSDLDWAEVDAEIKAKIENRQADELAEVAKLLYGNPWEM